MAVNKYFNHLTNSAEQKFFDDFVIESIKVSGLDVMYMHRTCDIDGILREPVMSEFDNITPIEAYFHDVQGFGGDGTMMTKFGFEQFSTVDLSISKTRWRQLKIPDCLERPREGDLVYIPFSKTLFEINHVKHEDPFWQLGRYNVFKLVCAAYVRGYNEKFTTPDAFVNTGGTAVNATEIDLAINTSLGIKGGELGDFSEKNPFGGI